MDLMIPMHLCCVVDLAMMGAGGASTGITSFIACKCLLCIYGMIYFREIGFHVFAFHSISPPSTGSQILFDAECSENGVSVGLVSRRIVAGVCSFSSSLSGCPSGDTDLAGVQCFSCKSVYGLYNYSVSI